MKKLNSSKIVGVTDEVATQMLSSIKKNLNELRMKNRESSSQLVTLWHLWPTPVSQSYPSSVYSLNVSETSDGVAVGLSYRNGMDVAAQWKADWQEADEEPFYILDELTLTFPKDRLPKDNLSCKFRFDSKRIIKDLTALPRLRESSAYDSY